MKKHKATILIIDPVGIKAGMDYYNDQLAFALRGRGYSAFVASNYISDLSHEVFFSTHASSKWGKLTNLLKGFYKSFKYAKSIQAKFVVNHCFSTEWKDLIPYLFSQIFGMKVITIAHDVSGFALHDSRFIRRRIYNHYSDYLVVHNEFSRNALLVHLEKEAIKKVHVIPHGHFLKLAEHQRVDKETARKALKIPTNEKMVLFFGQIKKQKGLDVLIQALSHCDDDIHLTIAGRPWKDNFEHYHNQLIDLGLENRVREIIRYISNAERDLLFYAADVIVIPYREIYQSGVLIMAMSYRLPIIASSLAANKEIVFPGLNGWLFTSEDVVDLATQIVAFFRHDDEERIRITEGGVQFLRKECSWEGIALKYDEMLS